MSLWFGGGTQQSMPCAWCRPAPPNCFRSPIGAARAWLSGSAAADFADVDRGDYREFDEGGEEDAKCLRWEGSDQGPREIKINDILPGDILLVDPERGRDPVRHLGSGGGRNGDRPWGTKPSSSMDGDTRCGLILVFPTSETLRGRTWREWRQTLQPSAFGTG